MSSRWVTGVCAKAGVLAAAALLLASCAVGPDFLHPAAPESAGYTKEPLSPRTSSADAPQGQPQRFAVGRDLSAEWWTLFRSPALNALVQQSLNNNPSLQTAMANLRAARQGVYAQEGKFFPTVDLNFNPTNQLYSERRLRRFSIQPQTHSRCTRRSLAWRTLSMSGVSTDAPLRR